MSSEKSNQTDALSTSISLWMICHTLTNLAHFLYIVHISIYSNFLYFYKYIFT